MRSWIPALALSISCTGCGEAPEESAAAPPERGTSLQEVVQAPLEATPPAEPPAPALDLEQEGFQSISFRQLSLLEADVNGLLDMMFSVGEEQEGEGEPSEPFEFPEGILEMDGENVAIVGYMIPLDWVDDSDRISSFMLVRDFAACCFGGMPRPDEWIDVRLPEGESAGFFGYAPIRVAGTLSVGLDRQEGSLVASVFQIVAQEVTDSW